MEANGERENRTAGDPAPTVTGEAFRWHWEESDVVLRLKRGRPVGDEEELYR